MGKFCGNAHRDLGGLGATLWKLRYTNFPHREIGLNFVILNCGRLSQRDRNIYDPRLKIKKYANLATHISIPYSDRKLTLTIALETCL